jgi:hypothetical protein
MFAHLDKHWENVGKPDVIGALLGELSLRDTESGGKEPMDGTVFPQWLHCAADALGAETTTDGYSGADILLDGKPPTIKILG